MTSSVASIDLPSCGRTQASSSSCGGGGGVWRHPQQHCQQRLQQQQQRKGLTACSHLSAGFLCTSAAAAAPSAPLSDKRQQLVHAHTAHRGSRLVCAAKAKRRGGKGKKGGRQGEEEGQETEEEIYSIDLGWLIDQDSVLPSNITTTTTTTTTTNNNNNSSLSLNVARLQEHFNSKQRIVTDEGGGDGDEWGDDEDEDEDEEDEDEEDEEDEDGRLSGISIHISEEALKQMEKEAGLTDILNAEGDDFLDDGMDDDDDDDDVHEDDLDDAEKAERARQFVATMLTPRLRRKLGGGVDDDGGVLVGGDVMEAAPTKARRTQKLLRIIAGSAGGTRLLSPQDLNVRPMMELVRGAVFSMLQSLSGHYGSMMPEGRWLDLYSGTGAVGLEALSRGCTEAHFVELDRWVLTNVLSPNVTSARFEQSVTLHAQAVETFLEKAKLMPKFVGGPFDFISVTPPYESVVYSELMAQLAESPLLHDDTYMIVEYPRESQRELGDMCGPLHKLRDRRYGRTNIALYGPLA